MPKKKPVDYQALFNSLPDRYIAFLPDDPDFTIVAENEAHATVGMVKRDDVIGKPLFEVFPDTSEKYRTTGVSDLAESFRRVIKTGQPDTMDGLRYDLPGPDGGFVVRYWKVTHYPVFDDAGKLALIYQSTEDITEAITTQAELERTQEQLKEALSAGIIGTWMWDIKKNRVIGDRYMAAMFGVSEERAAEGLPLNTFMKSIHPEDRKRIKKQVEAALKSDAIYEAEYRTIGEDGSLHWLLARGRVERDAQGNAVSFPGVLVDNTERKQVENNLNLLAQAGTILSSSLEYTNTLSSIARLIVPDIADWCTIDILDERGQIRQVAVAHKDPRKVQWAVQLREEQGPPPLDAPAGLPKVLRTGEPEYIPDIPDEMLVASAKDEEQLALLRKLGLTSVIVVPIKVQVRTVGAITLISAEQRRRFSPSDLEMAEELAKRASLAISNATLYQQAQRELAERERLEKALRTINDDLEQRVRERTMELNETNLSLQRSNQELQDFAYVASHDLQEPLRKIQAFGNLLETEYSEQLGDGRDYLTRMRNAAARMSTLIEDILAFSRVTTKGREFVRVDLRTVLSEVLEDLETRIQDTQAIIEHDKLPVIKADVVQMRQLFQNLIANALKFHRPGVPPKIKIAATTEISQTDKIKYVTLSFEDNGVGFEEKYIDRIFAVFQRLHNRESYEGTGIGLAVCRKIVERHGGTITAASKPGQGATFIVKLPVHHKKGETL